LKRWSRAPTPPILQGILVGSREGYRDVRKVFTLQPGSKVEILVRCEERI